MSEFVLKSKTISEREIASFFFECQSSRSSQSNNDPTVLLQVREENCFKGDDWLNIGTITLQPEKVLREGDDPLRPFELALRLGFFEWVLPSFNNVVEEVCGVLGANTDPKKKNRAENVVKAIAHNLVRCGFAHPIFDADSVSNMPFKRPTTLVVDTNSVLQGALDFVVRFLYPMARIKVPAIVNMEILNFSDRFKTVLEKNTKDKTRIALEHVRSQGGQRVLLRLELQTEAEIERPRLGADPLRGIVHPGSDSEDKSLGLQEVQRSFADRLILETAIQHRERLTPDHPIVVLTSDIGFAKMALTEGLQPLFFRSINANEFFDQSYTGTCFYPFVGSVGENRLYSIPLTELLWELASTFGNSRLVNSEKKITIEVCAMREGLTWSPFHSKDDLMWIRSKNFPVFPPLKTAIPLRDGEKDTTMYPETKSPENRTGEKGLGKKTKKSPLRGSYKFSLDSMLILISVINEQGELSDAEGMRKLELKKSLNRYLEYRNFLLAGDFVSRTKKGIEGKPSINDLWTALKIKNLLRLKDLFSNVPSFKNFLDSLQMGVPLDEKRITGISRSAFPTYSALSEICSASLKIPDEGVYGTPNNPGYKDFTKIAVATYENLRRGENYVLTGLWLEDLARKFGIHPVTARQLLDESRLEGLIERYTEGSTPETQYEKHVMHYLNTVGGTPVIQRINLFHGDYIIPGKASVSIRIEEKKT